MKNYLNYNLPSNYYVNTNGQIFDNDNELNYIIKDNLKYVTIDNELILVSEIVWKMFIGELIGKITYNDNNPLNCAIKNLNVNLNIDICGENLYINSIKFKPIIGYRNYFISEHGTVYSLNRNKFIIRTFNWRGYPTVSIVDDSGFRSPKKVHRLVYKTYCGELDSKLVIDHKDNNKQNPYYKNLQQITQKENYERGVESGATYSRWTPDEIEYICKCLQDDIPTEDIMTGLNYPLSHENYRDFTMIIHLIRKKGYYKSISSKYNIPDHSAINKRDRKLSNNDIPIIKDLRKNGLSYKEIADKFNCSPKTIESIINIRKWKFIE